MSDKAKAPEKPTPVEPANVACSVCLKEIPESVAMSSEADEYTQHFCGIECYNKWREELEKEPEKG
jgi:hypothetical protein